MYLLSFSKQIWWLFTFVNKKSINPAFKIDFLVQNNPWNLWGQLENSKWILCGRKPGVKCGYLRFLKQNIYLPMSNEIIYVLLYR